MLLLVVLSLLVLFMLIGTAFLMSSNQYRKASKASAQLNRLGNFPTKSLDRAVMQVLRDTGEPDSAIRYHSLLRDLYGSDGFEAQIYAFATGDPVDLDTVGTGYTTRFAGATAGTVAQQLGPTQGQFIDLYVKQLGFDTAAPFRSLDDPDTLYDEDVLPLRDARHVLKLERGPNGQPQSHELSLTKGYYNGALLTITGGPAAGQSTRILDYEYIPWPTAKPATRLFRFRVMTFPRADGTPLQINQDPARNPEILDLAGSTFIVNGRPFNGTGAGFNELARAGQPRLTAREGIQLGTVADPTVGSPAAATLHPEIALTPNATYHFTSDPLNSNTSDLWGARYLDPVTFDFLPLNPTSTSTVPLASRSLLWKYQTFAGPGDADESYDAPDFQNLPLAMQTVSPRARGRVVQGDPANPTTLEIDQPTVNSSQFLRLDLEDLPLPSYFRPDLANYWFHRLAKFAADPTDGADPINNDAVKAVLAPYGADGIRDNGDDPTGVNVEIRDQIVTIKRMISLRPIREDHPNFDGSNPASRAPDLDGIARLFRNDNIAVPYWEAVGPWDVDNDNDGVPESIWVDLGDPVAQAEDGTLYKPLYAFLIVDLDSRLNVNAHGLVDHIGPRQFYGNGIDDDGDGLIDESGEQNDPTNPMANFADVDIMAPGSGYGPAEISLRPIFSPNLPGNTNATLAARIGNPAFDDYARIIAGRPAYLQQPSVWGRHGAVNVRGDAAIDWTNNATAALEAAKVRTGIPYDVTDAATQAATLDRLTVFKFIGYPWWLSNYYSAFPTPSAFGTPPDMMGRYALGLDHVGQPVGEPRQDAFIYGEHSLLFDSPYELNLSDPSRRETPDPSVASTIVATPTAAVNDNAPFATAELERIARAHDGDAGVLPDRLWNLVDAFDPLKLVANQPALVQARAVQMFGSGANDAQRLAAAQKIAGENRRLITTDSYDLPVPGGSFLSRLVYGADGQPGRAGVDDDGDGAIDEIGNPVAGDDGELGWGNSDDYYPIMKGIRTPGAPVLAAGERLVPQNPTLVDLLKYRIQYERWKVGGPLYPDNELNVAAQYLLPPEIIAGKKLDLNRPFGDGVDNAGNLLDDDGDGTIDEPSEPGDPFVNGIVDEPEEAGEPFVDNNFNGRFDVGEFFFDVIGSNGAFTDDETKYNAPRDRLWQGQTGETIGFDYTHGGDTWDGRLFDGNTDGDYDDPEDGRLRNNGIIQRQTYARHLYCLMMLLMDEEYIASQNMRPDVNFNVSFLDEKGNFDMFILHQQLALEIAYKSLWDGLQLNASTDTTTTAFKALLGTEINNAKLTAYLWMLRKQSARKIAQWAINCVDYRDADSIMTPFEYDENPFDGWGCAEYNPTTGIVDRQVPIDGDIATNENWGDDFPAPRKFDPSRPINTDWTSDDYNDDNDFAPAQVPSAAFPNGRREETTRGVVWGAERPELLITETLALHDRRCTDDADPAGLPPHASIESQPANPSLSEPPDFDLDQKLKPRGSLFVELYNPWPADGARPAEVYGATSGSSGQQGVMLNRLSTIGVEYVDPVTSAKTYKRSPVWRMAVLYDPFTGRLSNQVLDPRHPPSSTVPSAIEQAAKQVLTTDPDGYGIEMDQNAERFVYFTSGDDPGTTADKSAGNRNGDESDPIREDDDKLTTDLPGDTADYQEVTVGGSTIYRPEMDQLLVWVPPLPIRWSTVPGSGSTVVRPYPAARRYFVARTERYQGMSTTNDRDVSISPILPGRYAVIGSSGLQLNAAGLASGVATRYVTPISQLLAGSLVEDWDRFQRDHLLETRRIELWPNPNGNPNQTNPNAHQVLVGENGGPEFMRNSAGVVNVTDSQVPGDGIPNNSIIDPSVAIPVEELSVSEPVEGYPSLTYQKEYLTNNPSVPALEAPARFQITADGEHVYQNSFDRPLDMEFELTRNGTTQNYRTLHLQRLANPSLPWNPPPFDDNGTPTFLHRPWLPVNPYLTIDSQSVDLTAYNSATQMERSDLMPVQVAMSPSGADPNLNPAIGGDAALQGNFFAPLTPAELADAPDHVLWAFIFMLKQETMNDVDPPAMPTFEPSIIPQDVWVTPADIRGQIENNPIAIEDYLAKLSLQKGSTDQALRTALVSPRTDGVGRTFSGQWCWHMFRRVLPDDTTSGNGSKTGTFRQWLHMKSLERGSQDRVFYTSRVPYSPFYKKYEDAGVLNEAPLGWTFDPGWTPRLLWQQSRPNARLFLRTNTGIVEASDLKNTNSRRVQSNILTPEESSMRVAEDDSQRNQAIWSSMRGGTGAGGIEHVVDYVLEQTLGFANESYAPELDRTDGTDSVAILSTAKPGAPEVATSGSVREPVSATPGLSDPNAILMPDGTPYDVPKEVLNAPRLGARFDPAQAGNAEVGSLMQSLSDITGAAAALAAQDKAALEREFYQRRQRLMKSTYPWLAWNDRPFTSADELMQVPAWSSSLMLHEYSVANPGTRSPYDGASVIDDGSLIAGGDGVRVSSVRYAAQQAPFGHLLNFFLAASMPSRITTNPISYAGAPNYYRILDYVEVPSRYVGTDTMMSPEVFNDDSLTNTPEDNIVSVTDPRYAFQPPFNKLSRERDPGRVNLNTVTGRRAPATASIPSLHWSEVYDGMMHRYPKYDPATGQLIRADGNLLDNGGNVLQLSHFGPAWRDVVLSRRGYVQFNADGGGNSVEKIDAVPNTPDMSDNPDTFAFGLNRNFPSVFSNPFRSADAGDLVPLPLMLRPGVEATTLRGHHYGRARDGNLETNPFASSGTSNSRIAWGVAGEDDDRNGIVDDIREAGFGDVNATDGDRIRRFVDPISGLETDRLTSSGIPLFSESLPEPAIDAERNPGMMYQPMTRLGNLVTTRSNVYAIWVTVGYFEVEKAPGWTETRDLDDNGTPDGEETQARFGGDGTASSDATFRARALYDRVYPEGYMLGEELGTDTGNTRRQRAFYIIDRTEPVGFKPGEDLNVDRMIRVRRRIE